MEESHRDLAITPGEWQAFMDDVQTTLAKFSVPAEEQAEVKEPQLSFLARKGRAIHDNGRHHFRHVARPGRATPRQNARRSWSLRNPSAEGYERRRLAAIPGWPQGDAGEPLKRRSAPRYEKPAGHMHHDARDKVGPDRVDRHDRPPFTGLRLWQAHLAPIERSSWR